MADESGSTEFKFYANTKPAEESLDAFGDKVTGLGKKIGVALAAYLSFSAIKGVLEKSIDAAIESDKAVKELNNSLAMTGQFTQAASASFQAYASELQKATGVTDETIMRGASTLVTIGKIHTDRLNEITKATLDLSVAMHVDASSAFDIMAKAANGNVMALSKYGITAKEASSNSEKFAEVLKTIETRFGGLAAANLDPFQRLKVSADEAFEAIGKLFTHSSKFQGFLVVISKHLDLFSESLSKVGESANVIDSAIDSFFAFGNAFLDNVLAPVEKFSNFITTAFMGVITSLLGGLTLIAQGFDALFKTSIGQSMNDLTEKWALATTMMAQDSINGVTTMTDTYRNGFQTIEQEVDEASQSIRSKTVENMTAAAVETGDAWTMLGLAVEGTFKRMDVTAKQFSDTFRNSVAGGITNALSGVGKALVQGGNAFQAFAAAALGALGQVAIQMGMMLIMAGLGWSLIPGFQASAGAVVFGAALVVLGGALQAIAGSMSSSAGGATAIPNGGTGVGGINDGSSGSFGGPTAEDERQKAQTGVQIIVQGNILNNRETALELAQVLNDNFDTNGTFIRATG